MDIYEDCVHCTYDRDRLVKLCGRDDCNEAAYLRMLVESKDKQRDNADPEDHWPGPGQGED